MDRAGAKPMACAHFCYCRDRVIQYISGPGGPDLISPTRVVGLKFNQQFDRLKKFEQQPSGAEAHLFGDLYGTTEVVP
jgi:hypothetical protein